MCSRSLLDCIQLTKCTPDPGPTSDILKTNTFVKIWALIRELILLNIGLVAIASERGNAIYDPKSLNIPERSNVVLDAWRAHILHFLRTGTSSSRSNFWIGTPLGLISNSPTSSLLASMTMVELVALRVLSTYSSMSLCVFSLISWSLPTFTEWSWTPRCRQAQVMLAAPYT